MQYDNPLIIQTDRTILLDVHSPRAEECRDALIPFAELERSPEHIHTYRLTPLSLWNAASAGFSAEDALAVLREYARYDVPQAIEAWIGETAMRFGKLRLIPAPKGEVANGTDEYLYLITESVAIYKEISALPVAKKYLVPKGEKGGEYRFLLSLADRGTIKQELLKSLWPVKDDVPLVDGEALDVSLRDTTLSGQKLTIRSYQKEAAAAIVGNKGAGTGFGTVVLPCGAGKTIVGMTIMDMLKTSTLIVTTNISAVHQWIDELLDKTTLTKDEIAEYTGESKEIKSVTVATYQILTYRADKESEYTHFSLFRKRAWGLIIYDEVHTLPAPVFRVVAEIQAIRRVGLTATLVREDGLEGNVFSLVGPKRYDVPWKELERSGYIASAECVEIRLNLPSSKEIEYAVASARLKHRIASENAEKLGVVKKLVSMFPNDKILIIGQYLSQLQTAAKMLCAPIITGKIPNAERDKIYADFRANKIKVLVVSKVANFAIDLPDASIAIEISGSFGSRQEEAQRLGRILRPKERIARFFTLITRGTVEEEFGANRQKFLAEQGYSYRIVSCDNENALESLSQNRIG